MKKFSFTLLILLFLYVFSYGQKIYKIRRPKAMPVLTAGSQVTLYPGTYIISANYIIPDSCYLHVSGGARIVSDNVTDTIIFSDKSMLSGVISHIFDSDQRFSGEVRCVEVYPEWFGGFGDSITDVKTEFASAINLAKLTTGKILELQDKCYYIGRIALENFDGSDLTINGNGARIRLMTGVGDYRLFVTKGDTSDIAYSLDKPGYKGERFIQVNNATFRASIAPGDIIHLTADSARAPAEPEYNIGELHEVTGVWGNYIMLAEALYDTYDTAQDAVVRRIVPVMGCIRDVHFIAHEEHTNSLSAIWLIWGKHYLIENCRFSNLYGNDLWDICSYKTRMKNNVHTHAPITSGGYAIGVGGASTGLQVLGCSFHGNRHALSTNGNNEYLHGICWDVHVDACSVEKMNLSYGIGTHPAHGSMYISNCRFRAGLLDRSGYNKDTLVYEPWDVSTAYVTTDTVWRDSRLFVARQNNTGYDPMEYYIDYWRWTTGNNSLAFQVYGGELYVDNCIVRGFQQVGSTVKNAATEYVDNFHVSNVTAYECEGGIELRENIRHVDISNFKVLNKYFSSDFLVKDGAPVDGESTTIDKINLSGLEGYNINGIGFYFDTKYLDSIMVISDLNLHYSKELNHTNVACYIEGDSTSWKKIVINQMTHINGGTAFQVDARNFIVNGFVGDVDRYFAHIGFNDTIQLAQLTGSYIKFRDNTINYVFNSNSKPFINLDIDATIDGQTTARVVNNGVQYITNLYINGTKNIGGDLYTGETTTNIYLLKGLHPNDNIILGGSNYIFADDVNFQGEIQIDGNTRINTSGYFLPISAADVSAPNNSIYYSSTQGKLVYKDSGGVVRDLY